jgi:hypothetical protein
MGTYYPVRSCTAIAQQADRHDKLGPMDNAPMTKNTMLNKDNGFKIT